jgi:hypothetical protein
MLSSELNDIVALCAFGFGLTAHAGLPVFVGVVTTQPGAPVSKLSRKSTVPGLTHVLLDTVKVSAYLPVQPPASVAVTVKVDELTRVGVPVSTPSDPNVRPVGSEPEVTAYV